MSWSEPEFATIAAPITHEFGVTFPPTRRIFAEAAMRRAIGLARERSAVFGMPKEAIEAGIVDIVLPLDSISRRIADAVAAS